MKRALVIGGTGFIGLNLVDALLAESIDVRVTRRRKSITAFVSKRPVELVDASLEDRASLVAAMADCDTVFLVAGHYPRYSLDLEASVALGVSGVRNAGEAALEAGVSRFVYTSSIATLAQAPEERPADERDQEPTMPTDSVYRAVKWAMEREVETLAAKGLNAVTLLPGGCVGPWDVRCGTGGLMVGVIKGVIPWWIEGLVHVVHVGDVARAHIAAARLSSPQFRYCLSGHPILVGDLFERIVSRYGGKLPAERLDADTARARADHEEQEAAKNRKRVPMPREMVDIISHGQPIYSGRSTKDLALRLTSLDSTLDEAYAWFARYRYVPQQPEHSGLETT